MGCDSLQVKIWILVILEVYLKRHNFVLLLIFTNLHYCKSERIMFRFRRTSRFPFCKCKLMLMVQVMMNKRRTLVLFIA